MTAEARSTGVVVELPSGEATVSAAFEQADDSRGTVAIAHGAGSRYDNPFLIGFARRLREARFTTVRFNFPYSEAGRRMPGPAAHAVATWAAVEAAVLDGIGGPVWAAGRSYGGRMASMAAAEGRIHPRGLAYLGYPLHPPGRPDRPRAEHLPRIAPPQLFVSGTNDPFVDPHPQLEDAVASAPDAELVWMEAGGHGFEVKGVRRRAEDLGAQIAGVVLDWIERRG